MADEPRLKVLKFEPKKVEEAEDPVAVVNEILDRWKGMCTDIVILGYNAEEEEVWETSTEDIHLLNFMLDRIKKHLIEQVEPDEEE